MAQKTIIMCDVCEGEVIAHNGWVDHYSFKIRPLKKRWYYHWKIEGERELDVCEDCLKKIADSIDNERQK